MLKNISKQPFNSLSFRFTATIIVVELVIASVTGTIYATNFTRELERRARHNLQVPVQLANNGVLEYSTFANRTEMEEIVGQKIINSFIVGANDNIFFSIESEFLGTSFQDYISPISYTGFDLPDLNETRSFIDRNGNLVLMAPLLSEDGRTIRFYAFIEISNQELIIQRNALIQLFVVGGGVTVLMTSMVIYLLFDRTIFNPIYTALNVVKTVTDGNLDARIPISSNDEIGSLHHGINEMIIQLQTLVTDLETRVANRTRDLTVSSEISQQITTVLNLSDLLLKVVELTKTTFDFYQVNIYLFNKKNQQLELKAASGQVNQEMIISHRIFWLEGLGMVPLAARTHKPVVNNNVLHEPMHLPNPWLPLTRSEITLPILFGDDLLGVLNLQSDQLNRFSQQDIELFTAFANQIATALRNAILFEEVEIARNYSEQADKAKSTFLASTSHELRTPLNAIINLASFVKRGVVGPLNPKQEEMISLIWESGRNLLNLINDVLDMSKIESGSLKLYIQPNVDIVPIIAEAISVMNPLLENKPVTLETVIPNDLPLMNVDPHRLKQILLNVLSNAIKFTDEGQIILKVVQEDQDMLFSVRDTGIGIADKDIPLVFEKFAQTESGLREGTGTGLGMPITKSLVEAHQGNIRLESEFQVGTTFYIRLPISSNPISHLNVFDRMRRIENE